MAIVKKGLRISKAKKEELRVAANTAAEKLILAINANDIQEIKDLIRTGVRVNCYDEYGRTPLMFAVLEHNLAIAEFLLLKERVNIDRRDSSSYTALLYAVDLDDLPMTKLLLSYGAGLYITDEDGNTATMIAAGNDYVDLLKFLVEEERFNLSIKNDKGQTALDLAIEGEAKHAVEYLKTKTMKKATK